MKYILRLSREHPSLPQSELAAVLEGESVEYRLQSLNGYTILDAVDAEDASFLSRLAYTLSTWEHLGEATSLERLAGVIYDSIPSEDTFRISGTPQAMQVKLGGLLDRMGLDVDLKNPQSDIGVFESDGLFIAGVKIDLRRNYQMRRPQYRPYFHPTSMHPKLARAMVNLARVRPGETILDPFCGTGGILIEAGLMGLKLIGWDLDERMAEGSRQNLKQYGLSAEVARRDALESEATVDAIVTDPPYGRSSRPSEEPGSLYRKFISNARSMLQDGSYMTLMLPSERKIDTSGFDVKETFDVRMHKSLTRRIWVLKAI